MKKIAFATVLIFLAFSGIIGCRTAEEWRKIDNILASDSERGKYFAIWDDKIQVKTDTWEDLMRQTDKKCPKKTIPFIYFRPKKSWRDK